MKKKKAVLTKETKRYFAEAGRRGGVTRWSNSTPEERSEAARKAVQARWQKEHKRSI